MLLKHKKERCNIEETELLASDVVDKTIKDLTPYPIWSGYQELLESFSRTLTNYSPISINIADYWNKDDLDTGVFYTTGNTYPRIKEVQPFELDTIQDKDASDAPDVDPNFGLGFKDPGGAFVSDYTGTVKSKDNYQDICQKEGERFFINSLIGVQDNLAKVHLNNIYTVTSDLSKNSNYRYELQRLNDRFGLDSSLAFNNVQSMFGENASLYNNQIITKKGTPISLKAAAELAHRANIQGKIGGDRFHFKTIKKDAFSYHVESNLLPDVFENFVKPLTHPIGIGYDYKMICGIIDKKTDDVLTHQTHTLSKQKPNVAYGIGVSCLCHHENTDGTGPIECDGVKASMKVISSGYLDQYKRPIPTTKEVSKGVTNDLMQYTQGFSKIDPKNPKRFDHQHFRKFEFTNRNYLIEYTHTAGDKGNLNGFTKRVIQYYEYVPNKKNNPVLGKKILPNDPVVLSKWTKTGDVTVTQVTGKQEINIKFANTGAKMSKVIVKAADSGLKIKEKYRVTLDVFMTAGSLQIGDINGDLGVNKYVISKSGRYTFDFDSYVGSLVFGVQSNGKDHCDAVIDNLTVFELNEDPYADTSKGKYFLRHEWVNKENCIIDIGSGLDAKIDSTIRSSITKVHCVHDNFGDFQFLGKNETQKWNGKAPVVDYDWGKTQDDIESPQIGKFTGFEFGEMMHSS